MSLARAIHYWLTDSAIHVFTVADLEYSNFAALIVDEIDDAVIGLAHTVSVIVAS